MKKLIGALIILSAMVGCGSKKKDDEAAATVSTSFSAAGGIKEIIQKNTTCAVSGCHLTTLDWMTTKAAFESKAKPRVASTVASYMMPQSGGSITADQKSKLTGTITD